MKEEIEIAGLANDPDRSPPQLAFPDEPFPCPACGQLLAPTCRVCVACEQPVDPANLKRREATHPTQRPATAAAAPPVSFSWQIFFVVLLAWLVLVGVSLSLVNLAKAQLISFGLVLGSSIWVLQDAHTKSIPKPFRWAFGSVMLWIVFFPWYLSRRRSPTAPCRWVEAELTPVGRFLAFALIILLVLSLVAAVTKGPALH
jgi:hypothetical protein